MIQVYFKNYKKAIIDIFFVNKTKNTYTYKFPYNIQYYKEFFYYDEIFPIKKYIFGPITLNGPNDPTKYLSRTYGKWDNIKKWNSKNYFTSHITNSKNYYTIIPKNFHNIKCIN